MEPYDQHMKRKMENHSSDWNGEKFWEELEGNLPKKKKKRRLALWLFWPLAFLMGGGMYFWLTSNAGDKELKIAIHGENYIQSQIPNQSDKIEQTTNHNIESFTAKSTEVVQVRDKTKAKKWDTNNYQSKTDQVNLTKMRDPQSEDNQFPEPLNFRGNRIFEPFIFIPSNINSIKIPKTSISEFLHPESNLNQVNIRKSMSHQLKVLSGISKQRYAYSATTDEGSLWATDRSNTESSILATSFGLQWTMMWNSTWGVSFGAQYRSYLDQLVVDQSESSTDPRHVTKTISTTNGDTTVSALDYQTTITNRSIRHQNTRSYLSVPIGLVYQRTLGSWRLQAEGGVVLHRLIASSGKSFHSQTGLMNWSSVDELTYHNNMWNSIYISACIERRLTQRISVFLQPQWEWSKVNLLVSNSTLTQTMQQFGIQTGLSFHL